MKIQKKQEQKKQEQKQEQKKYEESSIDGLTLRVYESGFAALTAKLSIGDFVVYGKIRQTKDGKNFFAFPSYKGNDGKYHDQAAAYGDSIRADIDILVSQICE